jgi:hypothetical protein
MNLLKTFIYLSIISVLLFILNGCETLRPQPLDYQKAIVELVEKIYGKDSHRAIVLNESTIKQNYCIGKLSKSKICKRKNNIVSELYNILFNLEHKMLITQQQYRFLLWFQKRYIRKEYQHIFKEVHLHYPADSNIKELVFRRALIGIGIDLSTNTA